MSEALLALAKRTVEEAAVISVDLPNGVRIEPWPVDWLRLTERELAFFWIGPEETLHQVDVAAIAEGVVDGSVVVTTRQGQRVTIEWAWDVEQRAALRRWAEQLANGTEKRRYPEDGWFYAELPAHVRERL